MTERYLTTTQAADWLNVNYGMDVQAHHLRRAEHRGELKAHRTHEKAWATFTRETLAKYAEGLGYARVSYNN